MENAELQLKLSSLEEQVSCLLDKMRHSVTDFSTELTLLKYCIDNNVGNLANDDNSSHSDTMN